VTAAVFWAPHANFTVGEQVVLEGAEGHHGATVRRLRVGERAVLTDGQGTRADSVVTEVGRDRLVLAVQSVRVDPPPSPRLVVVQALPKGDRGETAVETLTEVGVDVIVPWSAARCVTQWRDQRGAKALARWRSTAREAAKQSRRAWHPVVEEPVTTAALVRRAAAATTLVLHEAAAVTLADVALPVDGDVLLVVGPEGGVTDEEIAALEAAGARAVRLGPEVLRASTAAAVALGALGVLTRRWSAPVSTG